MGSAQKDLQNSLFYAIPRPAPDGRIQVLEAGIASIQKDKGAHLFRQVDDGQTEVFACRRSQPARPPWRSMLDRGGRDQGET